MPDPSRLRERTQIVLPRDVLDGIREDLQEEFTVTVLESGDYARIIGSPVVIDDVSGFLVRNGVSLP